jgi:hypothetical protein
MSQVVTPVSKAMLFTFAVRFYTDDALGTEIIHYSGDKQVF